MNKKIVTLGEIMLRLSPPDKQRIAQANQFDVVYGGGEANVAVSLANYGCRAEFVSKLPDNPLGQAAINELRKWGVATERIVRGGDRIGIYFLENGASMRASNVVYDRADSAIARAKVEEFDFEAIFEDCDWFHFSGITPALSQSAAELTKKALQAAKAKGVTVSCDLNYRKKLWTPTQAQKCMTELMEYVDVCIGNEEDAEKVLGFTPTGTDVTAGDLSIEGYQQIFKQMKQQFDFQYVVTTLRQSHSASDNGWSALSYDGQDFYRSAQYEIRIVDRVGGGDSFSGGLIYGLLKTGEIRYALDFATAASALKQTIFGDFNLVSVKEVETLMQGDASGRVSR